MCVPGWVQQILFCNLIAELFLNTGGGRENNKAATREPTPGFARSFQIFSALAVRGPPLSPPRPQPTLVHLSPSVSSVLAAGLSQQKTFWSFIIPKYKYCPNPQSSCFYWSMCSHTRGQSVGVDSLPPPCGSQGSNSGCQA